MRTSVVGALLIAVAGAPQLTRRPTALRPPIVSREHRDAPPIVGNSCTASPAQAWQYDTTTGAITLTATGACLTAASWPPADATAIVTAPCSPGSAAQNWMLNATNAVSLTLRGAPNMCANLAGYGTTPGTQVWLYTCDPADCQGNCAWELGSGGALSNPPSGLCVDANTGPPPPHTCDSGSPSASLPFCDSSLDTDSRIEDLWARLSDEARVELFSIPIHPNTHNAALNIPSVYWDITCIAGLAPGNMSPQPNVTVFSSTTGQAASFDTDLVSRISRATAHEGRIVNQVNYRQTGGTTWQGVLCDGGPLANTQHDPRWGRVSETYGEDYWLTAAMGIAATQALQQRTAPVAGTDGWLKTSQVTRHFMGTHGANDMANDAEEYILPQWLEEHQMRVYEAFQRPEMGGAEGVMCAISAFAEAGDVPPPRNVPGGPKPWIPNCVNTFLLDDKLRGEWGSECFVQSDCCDSIDAVVNHKYVDTLEEAVAAVINAGLGSSYGNYDGITTALNAALASGAVSNATYAKRIKRTLRTLFRVGVFDTSNSANPYAVVLNETDLDGPVNRALAREVVGRTAVMLANRGDTALPLAALPARVSVIGPFGDCASLAGGYGGHDDDAADGGVGVCSYGHTYSGYMSSVSTYLSAMQEEAAGSGTTVTWSKGSRVLSPLGADGLSNATAAAAASDLVLLVLGTGTQLEAEGRDRSTLTLPAAQLALLAAVSGAIPATSKLVVVLVTAGTVDVDLPRADAVFYCPYQGEETGHGLLDLLMGRALPSARMPLTTFRDAYLKLIPPTINFNMVSSVAGWPVGRTYRFFNDSDAIAHAGGPSFLQYRFGYGLSYCTVTYSGLSVQAQADNSITVQVLVTVSTRSAVLGPGAPPCREATQVYLTLPPGSLSEAGLVTPTYSLAAFASTPLPPPQAPPTPLFFHIPADMALTTFVNGTRALVSGSFTVSVSGHLPDDAAGLEASNVVTAGVSLPWSGTR
jgi:beta-glucosidase-like glycosyl hydrolase